MPPTLSDLIPRTGDLTSDTLLGRFLDYADAKGLRLYPAQETAILEVFEGKNVILNTPTGSGKSLVAAALHFKSLAQGRRSVYTCPIKALVNEKWLALCNEFGADNVGLSTGDASVNRDAPILCCTAEVLANLALREGAGLDVQDVVMDEFHYYADRERGVAWQVPLLTLARTRFLLMSATLGDTSFFEEELTHLNGRPTVAVKSQARPVPLEFSYAESPLSLTLERLVQEGKAPVYLVHFTQLEAASSAQDFTSLNLCTKEEKLAIQVAIEDFKFNSPYGPDIKRWLRQGIGLHHAGLLPRYRVLLEQLAQKGLLKIICGTDTLGVGINVPIRTVLFTRLCKYDGQKTAVLSARDFHQIAGRAGRKGFDDVGWVVAQAPEHVIENARLTAKAAAGGRKFVRRQAPDRNFANWDQQTFERLKGAQPERLQSRFQVGHGMLLNVLSRKGDGCEAMRDLIRSCHERDLAKAAHRKRAWQLFRALLSRNIVAFVPHRPGEAKVQVNVELQDDFSMNQALSLYLLETIPLLDPESPDYALDLLTLVEAILEDPDIILRKQLDRVKQKRLAEMKMEGIEYEQRMAELDKLEYPKPLREFVYGTFNEFAARHPWVGEENIRPKSIAREMFEQVQLVLGLRARLRHPALGRAAAAPPERRLQGARPDRAGQRQERPGAGDGGLPGGPDPPGGFQPPGRVGEAAGSGLPPPGGPGPAPARGRGGRAGHHPGRPGLHRRHPGPGLHLPARPAGAGPGRRRGRPGPARGRPGHGPGRAALDPGPAQGPPGSLPGRPWPLPPGPGRAQPASHLRAAGPGRGRLARPADAGGPGRVQRLGGRIPGGPGRLPGRRYAGPAPGAPGQLPLRDDHLVNYGFRDGTFSSQPDAVMAYA